MSTASTDLLIDAFGRVREVVRETLHGLTADELGQRVQEGSNPIGWLVWHLTRVQDDHLADAAGTEQVWHADGFEKRFELGYSAGATGYGHGDAEVAAFGGVSAELLAAYHDAVHDRTTAYLSGLDDGDLARVVDESWQPPVTLAARLVSVVSDDLQHAGQAAFVRGLLGR
ncbi:DUF664 domain-containing protein [Streptacidiphilus sp. PB12-B1b]|uniref:mycothiol transferase n=1 Tax=Streptacidiphilus sp. PB12-B1b TaxID=2705012 RepID=UPI0015FC9FEE|nr:DUF664 domain-containing protein [Streptacidiphilus sp. PB12-B1b]QMU76986.1 DUF664 domain-containing protein [Streptacidiphilus sp. PB12-B1b]